MYLKYTAVHGVPYTRAQGRMLTKALKTSEIGSVHAQSVCLHRFTLRISLQLAIYPFKEL